MRRGRWEIIDDYLYFNCGNQYGVINLITMDIKWAKSGTYRRTNQRMFLGSIATITNIYSKIYSESAKQIGEVVSPLIDAISKRNRQINLLFRNKIIEWFEQQERLHGEQNCFSKLFS